MEGLVLRVTEALRNHLRNNERNDLPAYTTASSLAHHGLLGPLTVLRLWDEDLSSIPVQQLVSLGSCVTELVELSNLSGFDLVTFLSSLKCETLIISAHSLGKEETQAVVSAMESSVKEVELYLEMELDIEALLEYSGQGRCDTVMIFESEHLEVLKSWAKSHNWTWTVDGEFIDTLILERNQGAKGTLSLLTSLIVSFFMVCFIVFIQTLIILIRFYVL